MPHPQQSQTVFFNIATFWVELGCGLEARLFMILSLSIQPFDFDEDSSKVEHLDSDSTVGVVLFTVIELGRVWCVPW